MATTGTPETTTPSLPGSATAPVSSYSIETHGGKITYSGEIPTVGKIVSFEDTERNVVCAMEYDAQALKNMSQGF